MCAEEGGEWGQFIFIHPEMYEYKQDVQSHYGKYVVHQYVKESFDTTVQMNKLNIHYAETKEYDFKPIELTLFDNPVRYLLLGTIQVFNFIYSVMDI